MAQNIEQTDSSTQRVFGAILAGGSGTRMGNAEKPKQFMMLGEKPILIHTVEKFIYSGACDAVVVLTPETWMRPTRDLLAKFAPTIVDQVHVCAGGPTRNDTIYQALLYIEKHLDGQAHDIIVTHDAVRPFVTSRIIEDNITAVRRVGACDTVIPATDTIVESTNATSITSIPERRFYYQGQTPQSFEIGMLRELIESLTPEEQAVLTDAAKIFVLRGREVELVRGDVSNIKITYPQDLRIAAALMEA